MKAWKAEPKDGEYAIIVFAETRGKARYIALHSEAFEYFDFIDIEARRYPVADSLYRGQKIADWYDTETRVFLVKELGWRCTDVYYSECLRCPANKYCIEMDGDVDEEQRS